ncbi:MAG: carboxymuconolactone decarboxylase family protein [Chloroflexi bacterium]|nr:carboxymuconolactone decarboxylase family protein [Chloroflexota bacterium]
MKLDNRTKELIAIGASLTAHCQPCLQYHVSKAIECGATEDEIAQAIEIGKMVRKGADAKMDQFAASLNPAAVAAAGSSNGGCGCGS